MTARSHTRTRKRAKRRLRARTQRKSNATTNATTGNTWTHADQWVAFVNSIERDRDTNPAAPHAERPPQHPPRIGVPTGGVRFRELRQVQDSKADGP